MSDPILGATLGGRFVVTKLDEQIRGASNYIAEQVPLGRLVTIKMLDEIDLESPAAKRFAREASALVRLRHPNTISVFDQGTHLGRPYLAIERLVGRKLDDLFVAGATDPGQMLNIAHQVASALAEAHEHGLVHRDLRPATILLTKNGDEETFVKVIDFGLVKDLAAEGGDTTADGVLVGTPWYMSPEQIRGGAIDLRSDVYSLGVILYRGFTGRMPFSDVHTGRILRSQLEDAPPPFGDDILLPPVFEWTVRCCLEKAPDARFADMVELNHALRACAWALQSREWRRVSLRVKEGRTILPKKLPAEWPNVNAVDSRPPLGETGEVPVVDAEPPPSRMPLVIVGVVVLLMFIAAALIAVAGLGLLVGGS